MQLTVRGRWEGQYYIGFQFHSQSQYYIGGDSQSYLIPQFYFVYSPYDKILDIRA